MDSPRPASRPVGTSAAEALSPAFPERAAWGTAERLRAWQAEALDAYSAAEPRDFLAAATPGAGKTTFALRLAADLLARGRVRAVTVVAPTEHLKKQWADAAARVGIRLDPGFANAHRRYAGHYRGAAVTYAQVAAKPLLHREITESRDTLVILDEVHHGGDALSWGEAIRDAFEPATRRLALTGTPFRSDSAPIPFVTYTPEASGAWVSRPDYSYGYARGLADGILRPVIFLVYAGHMRWRTSAGEHMEARLGEGNTKDITAQAWRTALDPSGEWIPAVLKAADTRLSHVRQTVPDAGGLVIAGDQDAARSYAQILTRIAGEPVTVVLSDEAGSSARIEEFAGGASRWMVAVRMVSEGVDVPRLAVGVYATSASTPLYFAQAVGRFVRARRRGETASLFIPDVPAIKGLAAAIEAERDHVLDVRGQDDTDEGLDGDRPAESEAEEPGEPEFEFLALESSANFQHALVDGEHFGSYAEPTTEAELDFIGIPGLLEPDQVHELLRHREARQRRRASARPPTSDDGSAHPPVALYRTLKEQRSLLNSLVGLYAKSTDQPHGAIHAELRRTCGGPAVSGASVTQLQARIDLLRRRLGHR